MSLEDDLKDVGDSIERLVDNAVSSQNFQELNNKISNTIRRFVYPSQQNRAQSQRFTNPPPGSGPRRQGFDPEPPYQNRSYDSRNRRPYPPRPHPGQPGNAGTWPNTQSGWTPPVPARQYPERFMPSTELSFISGFQILTGGVLTTLFGFSTVMSLISVFLMEEGLFAAILFALITCGGVALLTRGTANRRLGRRFRQIRDILGQREFISIKELSDRLHLPGSQLVEEARHMLRKGLFRQGHLDRQNTCLMVTHQSYQQYLALEQQQLDLEAEAEKKREELKSSGLSPEHQKMIEECGEYIRKIHQCNVDLPGEEISNKLSRLETVVTRILDEARKRPDEVTQLHKFMDYYMPTTWKLLEAYRNFEQEPIQSENILKTKREIENTLDTINAAFEKLLDDLFETTAWDISSDISVLESMLAQEGLTGNGFGSQQ